MTASLAHVTNGLNSISEKDLASRITNEPISNHYTVEKEIGRGKFAVVKRCVCVATGREFAAKFIRKRRRGKDCRNEILHEIIMLEMALAHPRLVDLKEVFETSHELVLITEYCAGGELFQKCVVEESFDEKHVIRIMRQILEGIVFLHERNIVHLDLKPQNILLTSSDPLGDIKLCDLGFARLVSAGEDIRDIIGTPDYVAPEVLSYEPIGTFTDIWSLGVLAYVMLTGHSPFAGGNKQETFMNISQVNLEFPEELFENVSEHAMDFIRKCLIKDVSDRHTARESLGHDWLKYEELNSPPVTPRSPFGSPLGCRRAHPPSPNSTSPELVTPKKFKYNDDSEYACSAGPHRDTQGAEDSAVISECVAPQNIECVSPSPREDERPDEMQCLNASLNGLRGMTEQQVVC